MTDRTTKSHVRRPKDPTRAVCGLLARSVYDWQPVERATCSKCVRDADAFEEPRVLCVHCLRPITPTDEYVAVRRGSDSRCTHLVHLMNPTGDDDE